VEQDPLDERTGTHKQFLWRTKIKNMEPNQPEERKSI